MQKDLTTLAEPVDAQATRFYVTDPEFPRDARGDFWVFVDCASDHEEKILVRLAAPGVLEVVGKRGERSDGSEPSAHRAGVTVERTFVSGSAALARLGPQIVNTDARSNRLTGLKVDNATLEVIGDTLRVKEVGMGQISAGGKTTRWAPVLRSAGEPVPNELLQARYVRVGPRVFGDCIFMVHANELADVDVKLPVAHTAEARSVGGYVLVGDRFGPVILDPSDHLRGTAAVRFAEGDLVSFTFSYFTA